MGEFLPQLIGFGFVALLLSFAHLFPHSPWTATLAERYGVRGSGPNGGLSRVDHFRTAAYALGVAVFLWAIAFGVFPFAERLEPNGRWHFLGLELWFMFMLLGALALACVITSAWKGLRWRPPVDRESTDEPAI